MSGDNAKSFGIQSLALKAVIRPQVETRPTSDASSSVKVSDARNSVAEGMMT